MEGKVNKRWKYPYLKWAGLLVLFVALILLVGFYFAALAAVIYAAVVLGVDSRIAYGVSLALLVLTAIFAALNFGSVATWLASIAFFALAMGVVIQVYQYVKEGGGAPDGEPPV